MALIVESATGDVAFIDPRSVGTLRELVGHAFENFRSYNEYFKLHGFATSAFCNETFLEAFSRLKATNKDVYARLQEDSLVAQRNSRFVVDPSSGTTGTPVLKFTPPLDDEAEAEAVRRAFRAVRVGPTDRVACLDVGASQIYLFYMRVLQEFGVPAPLFIKVTSDHRSSIASLRSLDPTLIVSIPSVLKRCLRDLRTEFGSLRGHRRKLIYIGEPMEQPLQRELCEVLDADCFSFYGTTEVGSIGIECTRHTGVHIPLDLFVPTLSPWPAAQSCRIGATRFRGTVSWTALKIRQQPVVKYAVNDLVEIDVTPCDCGSEWPVMTFIERVDETFFLYGITFTYSFFLEIVEDAVNGPAELAIKVIHHANPSDERVDEIVLILDESLITFAADIQASVEGVHPISELTWSNLVRVSINFVSCDILNQRKGRRLQVVDSISSNPTNI